MWNLTNKLNKQTHRWRAGDSSQWWAGVKGWSKKEKELVDTGNSVEIVGVRRWMEVEDGIGEINGNGKTQ